MAGVHCGFNIYKMDVSISLTSHVQPSGHTYIHTHSAYSVLGHCSPAASPPPTPGYRQLWSCVKQPGIPVTSDTSRLSAVITDTVVTVCYYGYCCCCWSHWIHIINTCTFSAHLQNPRFISMVKVSQLPSSHRSTITTHFRIIIYGICWNKDSPWNVTLINL